MYGVRMTYRLNDQDGLKRMHSRGCDNYPRSSHVDNFLLQSAKHSVSCLRKEKRIELVVARAKRAVNSR